MASRSTGSEPPGTGDGTRTGLGRKASGRCYNCPDCSPRDGGRARGHVVAALVGAGSVALNLLSFGLLQSLVSRCGHCGHRANRHRLRRGRLAAAADTVEFPVVD